MDVWATRLDFDPQRVKHLAGLLSPDEQARAARFRFAVHRRRFIVARGVLRTLLGRYTNAAPESVRLKYSPAGKPSPDPDHGLRFNLSHSHELALYAIAYEREVGVDLEYMRPLEDIERLAAGTFSARENAVWRQLPDAQKQEGFFNCWTRKEAYIKALGQGLSYPLDQFDVSLKPGEPARLLSVTGTPQEVTRWTFQAFNPGENYVAALVVEGQGWYMRRWQYDDPFKDVRRA
ncbi:MAG: 4'-phosphopantetheinyl transferase superfamily protein [Chloroflexi bacterium]|nr:4'-phosphopantetheinyl transferase superfamily protein [Chloroflexota bacterium]